MTEARDISNPLRKFMNDHKFTASDIMRGLVLIINGKLQQEQVVTEQQLCVT